MLKKILIFSTFSAIAQEGTPTVLTFFIKDLEKPHLNLQKKFAGITKKPIPKSIYVKKDPFVMHNGYVTIPSALGQVTLPRKTTETTFYLIVTPEVEPVFMFPNTISHWEIPFNSPTKMVRLKQIKQDQEWYWSIKPATLKGKKIPIDAIIVIAKPNNVVIPITSFKTQPSNQLLLPPLYVKNDFHNAEHALFMLNISKFFKPVQSVDHSEHNISYLVR